MNWLPNINPRVDKHKDWCSSPWTNKKRWITSPRYTISYPIECNKHFNGLFIMRTIRNITPIAGKQSILPDNIHWKCTNLLNTQKHIHTLNCGSQLHQESLNWIWYWKEVGDNRRLLHDCSLASKHTMCSHAVTPNNVSVHSLNSQIWDYCTSWATVFPL